MKNWSVVLKTEVLLRIMSALLFYELLSSFKDTVQYSKSAQSIAELLDYNW